jgi:hypothetical protein
MSNQSALPGAPMSFESASPSDGVPLAICASCNEPIRVVYYEANGSVLCSRCRGKLEAQVGSSGGMRRFRRALGFGLGAAVAGAAVYFGIAAATDHTFAIVAVFVGFIVGKAVFVGTGHRGGRRYQVLAVVLTYFAIASTYLPEVMKEARPKVALSSDSLKAEVRSDWSRTEATGTDSLASADAATPPAAGKAAHEQISFGTYLIAFAGILLLTAALPIIAGFSSIISVVILGVGLVQAWRLNRAVNVTISGPYRIAGLPIEGELAS